jgi:hypothetical protein
VIFDWFDAKEVDAFGAELAAILIEKLPPVPSAKKDLTLAKRRDILNKLFYKIGQFKRNHKLNVYRKAKFGTSFQWALKDAGYDEAFVNELTKELLTKM